MNIMDSVIILAAVLLIVTGILCMTKTINILKVIMGTEAAMKAISLVLVYVGYKTGGIQTIQSFIIIIVALEAVTSLTSAGIALALYKHYGSMDIRHISKLKD